MNLRRLKRRHDARHTRWIKAYAVYQAELAAAPDFWMDDEEDYSDGVCPLCDGDGRDKYTDYLLPCPMCQGEQHF